MVPLVRTFVSYPAGISRMPMGRFLLFSTLGSLPWNAALIYAGFVVGENYPQIEAAIKPCEYVIYAVVSASPCCSSAAGGGASAERARPAG